MPVEQDPRRQLFDDWAAHYDPSLQDRGDFPFDGYERVLDEIVTLADPHPGMTVLDLGIGTAKLAARFAKLGCGIWGIDFSAEMLVKARETLPQAVLVQADLVGEWPSQLERRFDRIVSGYVLHEFDLAAKVALLQRLVERHLTAEGRIVIGDIAFATSRAREEAHRQWADTWDEEEHYWAADEATAACARAGLEVVYRQVSSCGGIFVIESLTQGRSHR